MTDPAASQLVELARAGDQDAFAELFRESRPQIRSVGTTVFRGPGSEADLEDFCSDVWLLGLKYLDTFRGECSFATWIVTVARHKALAILQRREQSKNGDGRLVYQGPEMPDGEWENQCFAAKDRRLEAAAARSEVDRLMDIISPQYRELVQLHHLEGYTETEIAERTGLSVSAVRGRLSRAMVQLRKKVEKGADRNAPKISLTIQRVILREGESSE
jgi:RNA polymerase sigma factor (sigma-70 family)